jgi:hypothetical protein
LTDNDGVFYRTPTSAIISIAVDKNVALQSPCSMKALPSALSVVAVVPDSTTIYRLSSTASAFVTTTESFAFSDGMPTAYSNQRASELLAFVKIPLDVAKAIMTIPTQLIQARVNYDTQSTAGINAQVDSLKAQLSALQARRALEAAKASGITTTGP